MSCFQFALRPALAVLLLIAVVPEVIAQQAIPDTNPGQRLSQLIEHINSDSDPESDEFLRTGFEDQTDAALTERAARSLQVRSQLGEVSFKEVVESDDHSITAVCHAAGAGTDVLVTIEVADEPPHGINRIALQPGGAPDTDEERGPLTEEQKQITLNKLVEELKTKYVFPDVADKMAEHIAKLVEDGRFDDVDNAQKFARLLTDELRSICKDRHLGIRAGGARRPGGQPGRRQVDNHGFVKAEVLPGGIGYLKFNFFSGDKSAEKTAAAAMNFLGNSQAVIFDLRQNGGGSPDMIAFLSGYLFDESVHLNSFYNRPTDTTTETWSRDDVPGKRLGESVPVFVLTSNYTFSGAEEFTYNLKNMKRGVIVGETTGGGAHPVMPVSLGNRFSMSMPFARAINPVTNTNWEGTGVEPDVAVAAGEALDKAIELAKAAIKEKDESVATPDSGTDINEIMNSADELMGSQDFEKAAELYAQITEADPEHEMAWFRLGYCLHAAGKLDEAIEIHKKAAEFDGIGMVASYNLGCAWALQNNSDKAFEALDQAIEKGFDDLSQVENDSDLDSLRDDPRYETLVKKLGGG